MRNQRDTTPTNLSNNSTKAEEIVLLEKQGRSSQKLRSNLAQISSTIGQNMTDISNIGKLDKVRKILNYITHIIFFIVLYSRQTASQNRHRNAKGT